VTKPIDPKQLFDVLGKWISVTAEPEQGSAPQPRTPSSSETPSLPGFDVADALNRLGGKRAALQKAPG